ncbi:MAG: M36 family metallopeptidase, partial [Saprospiraceae bacterium]
TYEDLPTLGGNSIHGAGEIWCAMLWDLHWAFIDLYGWDADLNNGTGGNNKSMELVMEGMKMQPCLSGFVSGRDAILAADEAINDGIHACMIWDVFARRGLGVNANENDPASAGDGIADFESLATCVEELKIRKEVSELIDAGEDIDVTLTVINHKPDPAILTEITITEELADGLTYVAGSESSNVLDVTQNGNVITFTIGDMNYLDEVIVTYKASTPSDQFSVTKAYDAAEYSFIDAIDWWDPEIVTAASNQFLLSESDPNSGDQSWFVANEAVETQHRLRGTPSFTMEGDRPAIRFYSKYITEGGADGGLFEVSTDGGVIYEQLGEHMVRNGYPGGLQYTTFTVPFLEAFSGTSDGYEATYVDMSSYMGQSVKFRFQFGTDNNTADPAGGWWIDDFEYLDLVSYNSEVCVSSAEGDNACAIAPEEGTIIESQVAVSTSEIESNVQLGVYPNPTSDIVNVTIASKQAQKVDLSLVSLDGKLIRSMNIGTTMNVETFSFDVSDLPAGFYIIKASTGDDQIVKKVVIK